jgi:membrane-associated phospholipid phosphatase
MKRFLLFLFLVPSVLSAQTDTSRTNVFQPADSVSTVPAANQPKFRDRKTKMPHALIVPATMIAYGLTTIKSHGLYSSFQARRDIQKHLGGLGTKVDDYLIFAPYVEFAALTVAKVKCKNDLVNTGLLVFKSQVIMAGIVFPMKYLTHQERPYSYYSDQPMEEKEKNPNAFHSLPSGHTAQAFCAATVVHKEFRHRSPWPGVAAYAIAGSVGMFRMINDRHWQSDVIVGAGIGILATNIAYGTHQFKWGRKEICYYPIINDFSKGMGIVCRF